MEKISANNVSSIEKWVFYFLCGFALFSSTSIAMGNVFLSLAIVAAAIFTSFFHRYGKKL